ncbi:hypothetical protein MA16_Dca002280 [Dendrobium catenatum]|uniref:Uncharacterized protein n=1 Tax=Dendrobium catenatum TaxID=906689 RepID=A0A2I0W022_9ASPA|nr:hypothetical protein MA16_Dca002280 [Dendrobium catenatum]
MAKAAAAPAASALLRRSSALPPWIFSIFSPKPHIVFFSTSPHAGSFGIRKHALRPVVPPSDGSEIGNDEAGLKTSGDSVKKSRNELKKEARRAVRWGMDLSTFSPPQIKYILRYCYSLDCVSFELYVFFRFLFSRCGFQGGFSRTRGGGCHFASKGSELPLRLFCFPFIWLKLRFY